MWPFSFLLASSHHHPSMNFFYFLLLLVVLSAYLEKPQHAKSPDSLNSIVVTVFPNSSSAQLGVLAPGLPQNEVYISTQPQNEVYENILPQIEVFQIVLPQPEMNNTDLSQNGVFKIATINNQLFNKIIIIMDYLLNLAVTCCKKLTSNLVNGGQKFCWVVRNFLECLKHALEMYTWSLSENQASIKFKCRLTALFLKQSLYRKHDFAVCIYNLHQDSKNTHLWQLRIFSDYQYHSHSQIREEHSDKSNRLIFYGGGKAPIFSSDELLPYTSTDLYDRQYQFL